jgi:hypothetical protein
LDHQVEVDDCADSAVVSVALPLSDGLSGLTASLSLTHSSAAGNSPFGLGWPLSRVPDISPNADHESDDPLERFRVSWTVSYDPLDRMTEERPPHGTQSDFEYSPWRIGRLDANDIVQDFRHGLECKILADSDPEMIALRKAQEHADSPSDVLLGPRAGRSASLTSVRTAPSGAPRSCWTSTAQRLRRSTHGGGPPCAPTST